MTNKLIVLVCFAALTASAAVILTEVRRSNEVVVAALPGTASAAVAEPVAEPAAESDSFGREGYVQGYRDGYHAATNDLESCLRGREELIQKDKEAAEKAVSPAPEVSSSQAVVPAVQN